MHIGLIGGIGPAATEFYYRGLVQAHNAESRAMELTIVHAQLNELVQNLGAGAAVQQALIFRQLTERLKASGAAVVAITSMGGHFCISEFELVSPLPVVDALNELTAVLRRKGIRRIGVLGTRSVMASGFYGRVPGIDVVAPEDTDLNKVHETYMAVAAAGRVVDDQREYLIDVGRTMCERQRVEAVVLGGTDLFLVFEGVDVGYPVIDSAQIHIDALFKLSATGSSG